MRVSRALLLLWLIAAALGASLPGQADTIRITGGLPEPPDPHTGC